MKGKRISFDFDGVLDSDYVQEFVSWLLEFNTDIWVITTRNHAFYSEVKAVTDRLGIPSRKVIFTSGEQKFKAVRDLGIDVHLDDDWNEIAKINDSTDCLGLTNVGNPNWRDHIKRELRKT